MSVVEPPGVHSSRNWRLLLREKQLSFFGRICRDFLPNKKHWQSCQCSVIKTNLEWPEIRHTSSYPLGRPGVSMQLRLRNWQPTIFPPVLFGVLVIISFSKKNKKQDGGDIKNPTSNPGYLSFRYLFLYDKGGHVWVKKNGEKAPYLVLNSADICSKLLFLVSGTYL